MDNDAEAFMAMDADILCGHDAVGSLITDAGLQRRKHIRWKMEYFAPAAIAERKANQPESMQRYDVDGNDYL